MKLLGLFRCSGEGDSHSLSVCLESELTPTKVRTDAPTMPAESTPLQAECRIFARYLAGDEPLPYVMAKYLDAHEKRSALTATRKFDRFLVSFATTGLVFLKVADSYARLLAPASTLRKKLVLLLAILESSSPSYRSFEKVDGGGTVLLGLRILQRMAVFAVCVVFGAIVLLPAQVIFRGVGEPSKGRP